MGALRSILLCFALAVSACGDDGGGGNNQPIDAPPAVTNDGGVIDAPIDAPPQARPSPGDITGGAAGLRSPSYRLDVQIGHGASRAPIQAGDTTLEGSAPVKP